MLDELHQSYELKKWGGMTICQNDQNLKNIYFF